VLRAAFLRFDKWKWTLFGLIFAGCAVTLPLALWHPHAFMRNVVWLQTLEPFRMDSLSYLSWALVKASATAPSSGRLRPATAAGIISPLATRNTTSRLRHVGRAHHLHDVRVRIQGLLQLLLLRRRRALLRAGGAAARRASRRRSEG